jgi:hypothetical protein
MKIKRRYLGEEARLLLSNEGKAGGHVPGILCIASPDKDVIPHLIGMSRMPESKIPGKTGDFVSHRTASAQLNRPAAWASMV